MVASLVTALPVLAETNGSTSNSNSSVGENRGAGFLKNNNQGKPMMKPVVVGTVTNVTGNTITINRKNIGKNATTTTVFTVDATNSKVLKGNATSTVSNISVGDMILVQGTVTGTNVVATVIRDGQIRGVGGNKNENDKSNHASSTSQIQGNGQPVVAGTVVTVGSSTIAITNKSNVSYTIDASNAKITQKGKAVLLSDVKVGDAVVVQGVVNGNSVVASTVIDQTKIAGSDNKEGNKGFGWGFFGGVGQFFRNIFGF